MGRVTLYHGDCLEVMRTLEENSVDTIITDPPYGLSDADSGKGISQRIYNALVKIGFPDLYERNAKGVQGLDFAGISGCGSDLGSEDRAIRVETGIGVPERAVDLQRDFPVNEEVNNCDPAPGLGVTDRILTDELNAQPGQFLGDFVLKLGDVGAFGIAGDVLDSCLAEAFYGGFAVPIFASVAPGLPSLVTGSRSIIFGDQDVWVGDDASSQTNTAPCIVTLPRTVNTLMLRFDLSGRPVELLATYRADHLTTIGEFGGAELVRAFPTARCLATVGQPCRVRFIVPSADGAFALYWFHLWCPIKSITTTIIPQGGFMGKGWDSTTPDPQVWRELLRVLKPGGTLLAFGGTRTFHRLACAIEDAGFELRDSVGIPHESGDWGDCPWLVAWVYGSGFPKSHAIGKAIDQAEYRRREQAIRGALVTKGFTEVVWSNDRE